MREVVIDTETTGLDPHKGHRLVEIGCVEVINYVPSGKTFQVYIDPQRDMPEEAFAVHGLSAEFLSKFPPFQEIVSGFLDFIRDAPLVIHNAEFDLKFLNAELSLVGRPFLENPIVDTLLIARRRFPGSPASLDALCRRFGIDHRSREKHGALLDAEILADVYLELKGGRQPSFSFDILAENEGQTPEQQAQQLCAARPYREPRFFKIPEEELLAHQALLESLGAPKWNLPPLLEGGGIWSDQ